MLPVLEVVNKQGRVVTDLVSFMFNQKRQIYLNDVITDAIANEIILQIQVLSELSDKDITLVINSPGGSVLAGLAIYDAMKTSRCDIVTVCNGCAASMAAVLLAAGTRGKRFAYPNAEIMIHQVMGGIQGQASDVQIAAERIVNTKKTLNIILAQETGKTVKKIQRDTDRDYFMNVDEGINYGIIDAVVEKQS